MRQSLKYLLAIIGLAFLALLVIDFNERLSNLVRLSNERDLVATTATSMAMTDTSYSTQIAMATSETALRQEAYEDERLVEPGDILVIPVQPSDATPVPTPQPVSTPLVYRNWEFWLALFFDMPAESSNTP